MLRNTFSALFWITFPFIALGNFNLQSFQFPIFDSKGKIFCDIHGKSMDLTNLDCLKISDAQIITPNNNPLGALDILSKDVTIFPQTNCVQGIGEIQVSGPGFVANGKNWQISINDKNLVVNSGVQVLFQKSGLHNE